MNKRIYTIAKLFVFVLVIFMLYGKVEKHQLITGIANLVRASGFWYGVFPYLLLVVLLMPINWLFEALKWRSLVKPITQLTLKKAFIGVLRGVALGFITPHAVGDYLGRVVQFQNEDKWRAVGAIFISRSSQMVVTLFFGVFGVATIQKEVSLWSHFHLSWIVLLFLGGVLWLLYRFHAGFRQKWRKSTRVLHAYTFKSLAKIVGLSIVRYAVFSLQYYIVLKALGVTLPDYTLFCGITWVFLAKSVLPTFNFISDLGVRELSSVLYFEQYSTEISVIVFGGLILWGINILMPTFMGLYYVIKSKQIKKY